MTNFKARFLAIHHISIRHYFLHRTFKKTFVPSKAIKRTLKDVLVFGTPCRNTHEITHFILGNYRRIIRATRLSGSPLSLTLEKTMALSNFIKEVMMTESATEYSKTTATPRSVLRASSLQSHRNLSHSATGRRVAPWSHAGHPERRSAHGRLPDPPAPLPLGSKRQPGL